MELCARKLTAMQSDLFMLGEVHGAAFLGSRVLRAFRLRVSSEDSPDISKCWNLSSDILSALGKGLSHHDEIIGNAFAQSISIALSYDTINAPILDSRLFEGSTTVLVYLERAIRKYGNGDYCDAPRASTLAQAAGVVLAATTSGAGFVSTDSERLNLGAARLQCVDALFSLIGSMAYRKDSEVALVAGEALALYADAYNVDNGAWSGYADEWPETYDEVFAQKLPPHQQVRRFYFCQEFSTTLLKPRVCQTILIKVLFVLLHRDLNASSPHKRTAVAPPLLAIVGRTAKAVNGNASLAGRALVVEVTKHLGDIQNAFIKLLADPKSKQLSRESCCLGLAACQGLAKGMSATTVGKHELSQELNEKLLRAFGHTTIYGTSAMIETRAQNVERLRNENRLSLADVNESNQAETLGMEPSEVGGAAGLGEAALGAYREMANAAVALGRSDILYTLLLLSVSHPIWFTPSFRERYSAAALLGEHSLTGSRTNVLQMREALKPHLTKLLPRLLRARFDPNKQTRDQIETLWIGLTGGGAEARKVVTDSLLPTMDILIQDASSKLWRARVGASGALAEVIVG
jgi:proteasome component ECM29